MNSSENNFIPGKIYEYINQENEVKKIKYLKNESKKTYFDNDFGTKEILNDNIEN